MSRSKQCRNQYLSDLVVGAVDGRSGSDRIALGVADLSFGFLGSYLLHVLSCSLTLISGCDAMLCKTYAVV